MGNYGRLLEGGDLNFVDDSSAELQLSRPSTTLAVIKAVEIEYISKISSDPPEYNKNDINR